jgi:hypothetical protein
MYCKVGKSVNIRKGRQVADKLFFNGKTLRLVPDSIEGNLVGLSFNYCNY